MKKALNIDGALKIPDLSIFENTTHTRVRCTVCRRTGPVEEAWILSCLAGHPEACAAEGCTRVFTTPLLLARHVQAQHPEEYGWVEGESKADRTRRLKREHRARLKEAGIPREQEAA